jgi:ATP-binding cassette subfamily F protein uup
VIKHGTNLEIGYFDQLRETLDPEKSVADNVGGGRTHIKLDGKDRHVVGYLKGFLFSPKRSMMPVKALSGGERNRVILAKLFTQPANLLILDEPTNDLDMETLEVLEQKLTEFSGTLIIVSHDRQFLDNVVTSTLVFEADGSIQEYVGGYSDWVRQGKALAEADNPNADKRRDKAARKSASGRKPTKLGYMEQRELEQLPADIEQLEAAVSDLEQQVSTADFYSQDHAEVQQVLNKLTENQRALDTAIERWAELEERQIKLRSDQD